jgi:hypothetical protein
MESISKALSFVFANELAGTAFGIVAAAASAFAVYALNKGQKRAAKLAALAIQRWPVINFALATIENQVDDAVKSHSNGRYLPAYQVAKQLFSEEKFSIEDVLVMADFVAKEFSEVKYDKFKAKDASGALDISNTERQIGFQVANVILSAVTKDAKDIEKYRAK